MDSQLVNSTLINNEEDIENEIFASFAVEVFSNIMFLYRDSDLTKADIKRYRTGKIVISNEIVYATHLGGGFITHCRYLIATNQGKDISALEGNIKKWGLYILKPEVCFKVLDICFIGNRVQIILLHIPHKAIDMFSDQTNCIEKEIVNMGRKDFIEKTNIPPLKELSNRSYQFRTLSPIPIYQYL